MIEEELRLEISHERKHKPCRSSRPGVFRKNDVLRIFAKFTCAVVELHARIDIFKTKETSRTAITFLTKFSYILKTRRQCKEYLEVIPLQCYNTVMRYYI